VSHLTEEAAKRVWFINLPEDVEPVTPQDRIAELERENAALRVALEDIMTESDEQHIWRMARAALQKEAQP
jgi:hypothetical protein